MTSLHKPTVSGEIEKILEVFELHDDDDHGVCKNNYVACSVCGEEVYLMSTMYHRSHTAFVTWKPGVCDCSFASKKQEALSKLQELIDQAKMDELLWMLDRTLIEDTGKDIKESVEDRIKALKGEEE